MKPLDHWISGALVGGSALGLTYTLGLGVWSGVFLGMLVNIILTTLTWRHRNDWRGEG